MCGLYSQAWEEDLEDQNIASIPNVIQHYHFCAIPGAYMVQSNGKMTNDIYFRNIYSKHIWYIQIAESFWGTVHH